MKKSFSAARAAQICALGWRNNLSISWGLLLRSRLCCPLPSEGEKSFLWLQQCKHLSQSRQMVLKRSKRIHLFQSGTTIFEQNRWPTTLLIIHLQVALTTLKLRAHTCPQPLCKDTPTQSLKAWNKKLKQVQLPTIQHCQSPAMQYWVLSAHSLTTIHTWAHLALATHIKAG